VKEEATLQVHELSVEANRLAHKSRENQHHCPSLHGYLTRIHLGLVPGIVLLFFS